MTRRPRSVSMIYNPLEESEAIAINDWRNTQMRMDPRLKPLEHLHHVANEGSASPVRGGKMKAQGLLPGVSDYVLPVPAHEHHGMWLELKRRKGKGLKDEQREWLIDMRKLGYFAVWARGAEESIALFRWYLLREGRPPDLRPLT